MRVYVYFFTGIFLCVLHLHSISQDVGNNEFSSGASSFASRASSSENLSNGTMNYAIPIHELEIINGITIPVGLTYSSGNGIKVNQYHSWTGLGWNTSCNYAISRSVRGKDDFDFTICGSFPNEYDCHGLEWTSGVRNSSGYYDADYATGEADGEPDIYTVNLIGQTVSFYLEGSDLNKRWVTMPYNPDIQITSNIVSYSGGNYPSIQNCISTATCNFKNVVEFNIVDQYGFEYVFGGYDHIDFSATYNVDHLFSGSVGGTASLKPVKWHLQSIKEPFSNRYVNFTYEHERYSYWSGVSMNGMSLTTLQSKPNDEYYFQYPDASKYTRSFFYGHRLESIEFENRKVQFYAGTENTALENNIYYAHRGRMLDSIVVYRNEQKLEKYWLEYDIIEGSGELKPAWITFTKDKNIFYLKNLTKTGVSGDPESYDLIDNHLKYSFTYYNQSNVPRRCSMAQDWWGYYNGKDNSTLLPELLKLNGTKKFLNFADRRTDTLLVKNGLLKSVKIPSGGTTIFDYESNVGKVDKNFVGKSTISGVITGYDNPTTSNFICPLATNPYPHVTTFSRIYFDVLDPETEHINVERDLATFYNDYLNPSGAYPCFNSFVPYNYYNTTWFLYRVENGNYIEVARGFGLGDVAFRVDKYIDLPGRYQLSYDATHNSTFEHFSLEYDTQLHGAGVRVSKKLVSDDGLVSIPQNYNTLDSDDMLDTFIYHNGRWGYNFLPSIEGYYYNDDPIIPQLNDRSAKKAVISFFKRSPFLNFAKPIYYEKADTYRFGIDGFTRYTYTQPYNKNSDDLNTCEYFDRDEDEDPLFNQKTFFYYGGLYEYDINEDILIDLSCYDYNNSIYYAGRLLSTEIFDENSAIIKEQHINYIKSTQQYPILGRSCKRYVLDQVFSRFWEKKDETFTTICYDYFIDTSPYQVDHVLDTEFGITTRTDYTYNSRNNLLEHTQRSYRVNQTELYKEKITLYADDLTALPEKAEILNRNMKSVPFLVEYYQGDDNILSRELISGEKVEYRILNNRLVRENNYSVAGGQFILTSKANAWHPTTGAVTRLYYAKQGALSTMSPTNTAYFQTFPIRSYFNQNIPAQLDSLKNNKRVERYYYYDSGNLQEHISSDSISTVYNYDVLNRIKEVSSNNGRQNLEYLYYYEPDINRVRFWQQYSYPLDAYLPNNRNQNKETVFDGLLREYTSKVFNIDGLGNSQSTSSKEILINRNTYNHAGSISMVEADVSGTLQYVYENNPRQYIDTVKTISFQDPNNKLIKIYERESEASAVSIDDCFGNSRTYNLNTLLKTTITDENDAVQSETHDIFGNTIRVSKQKSSTEWLHVNHFYNVKNQLICQTDPSGAEYKFTYNTVNDKTATLLQPEHANPTKYYYDNLNRLVLIQSPTGDKIANIYDAYNQVIKTGDYSVNVPASNNYIFTNEIPSSNFQLLTEMTFDGYNNQFTFLKSKQDYIIDDEDNISNSVFEYQSFIRDDIGRPEVSIFHSHIGSIDSTFSIYNDANLLTSSTQKHSTPGNQEYIFNWDFHFDFGKRAIGTSLNDQRLSEIVYDDFNRIETKRLHETTVSTEYLQELNYGYDGFGRLNSINDIEDYSNVNCRAENLCNVTFSNLGDLSTGIDIVDISIYDGEGVPRTLPSLSYPFALSTDLATVNNFISALETDLDTYIFDDVIVSDNSITFLQTNIEFIGITTTNSSVLPLYSDCCTPLDDQILFAQKINYENSLVNSVEWFNACGPLNRYEYHYDDLGRLIAANHSQKSNLAGAYIGDEGQLLTVDFNQIKQNQIGNYSTVYQYDNIGNITGIARRGAINNQGVVNFDQIDDLEFSYNGSSNTLNYVTDLSNRSEGFENPLVGNAIYQYDSSNGRMIIDGQRNMNLEYNRLNEVSRASITEGELLNTYNGSGRLVSKEYNNLSGSSTIQKFKVDHIANIEYRDDAIFALVHGEGRIILDEANTPIPKEYEYHIRDYKDIIRTRFSDQDNNNQLAITDVKSVYDYYPYGLAWNNTFEVNGDRDFNHYQRGMSWIDELGLYTTEFRTLDPTIATWNQTDPKAADLSFLSPYSSMAGNPVMFSDGQGDNPIALVFLIAAAVQTSVKIAKEFQNLTQWNRNNRDTDQDIGVWESGAIGRSTLHLASFALNYVLPSSGQFIEQLGWAIAYDFAVNVGSPLAFSYLNNLTYKNEFAQQLNPYGENFNLLSELTGAFANHVVKSGMKAALGGYSKSNLAPENTEKGLFLLNPVKNYEVQAGKMKFYGKGDTDYKWFGKAVRNVNLALSLTNSVWTTVGTLNHGYIYSGYYISNETGFQKQSFIMGGFPFPGKMTSVPGTEGQMQYVPGNPWIGQYSFPQTLLFLMCNGCRPEYMKKD